MKLREMPRDLLVLTFAMIIANVAGSMVMPFLPLYLESLGASVQNVGFFFTMQVILAITFRILGGWISDNMGRLPTIALGGMMGMAARIAFVLAPTWEWALAGALFGEMGVSLVAPSFQAYTAEKAPKGGVSSTFGAVNALFLICMVIGPVLGGVLAREFGYKPMFWVAAAIFAVATVMRLWMAWGEPLNMQKMQPRQLVRDLRGLFTILFGGGLLTWLFIVDGFADSGNQLAFPFIPKFVTTMSHVDEAGYAVLFALMSLISALAMIPGGMFADKYGERWGVAVGMLGISGVWVLFTLSSTVEMFALSFALAGIAQAFLGPAFSSLLSKAVPKQSLGIAWGVFMTAMGILAIPAPFIGGLLYDRVDPRAPFLAAAAVLVVAVPLAIWKFRLPSEVVDTEPFISESDKAVGVATSPEAV